MRICDASQGLNKRYAIKRDRVPNERFTNFKMRNSKVFSILDNAKGI
jgi:hypothetical protein